MTDGPYVKIVNTVIKPSFDEYLDLLDDQQIQDQGDKL